MGIGSHDTTMHGYPDSKIRAIGESGVICIRSICGGNDDDDLNDDDGSSTSNGDSIYVKGNLQGFNIS